MDAPEATTPTLALVVISLNADAHIARCLGSVAGLAHQSIVVDSGSTDRTRDIAASAGATVMTHPFAGYGAQKQFALAQATTDWILCLDADEWLDEEARHAIAAALAAGPDSSVTGYRLRMRTNYLGHWMDRCAWLSEWKLRLVRRGAARWTPDVVHEHLEVSHGHVQALSGRILHTPYRDLADELRKINHYTEIIAARDLAMTSPRIWFGMLAEPPLVFLHKYFVQGGVLDGLAGLIAACQMSASFFLRHAKIWRRRQVR